MIRASRSPAPPRYTITQADLNAGSVTNTAKASAGGIDSNEDKATVEAIQNKALSLDKTASPTAADAVGDVISYSYVVTNIGNVRLAGPVTVADDKATVTCPALEHGRERRLVPRSGRVGHLRGLVHDHAGRPERRLGDEHRQGERGRHQLTGGQGDRDGHAAAGSAGSADAAGPAGSAGTAGTARRRSTSRS